MPGQLHAPSKKVLYIHPPSRHLLLAVIHESTTYNTKKRESSQCAIIVAHDAALHFSHRHPARMTAADVAPNVQAKTLFPLPYGLLRDETVYGEILVPRGGLLGWAGIQGYLHFE